MTDPRALIASERGLAATRTQDWPAAAQAFLEACQWAPEDVQAWYNLANARERAGDHSGALPAALRAARIDPRFPNVQLLLGNIHGGLNQFPAAAERFLTALEQEPRSMVTCVNLAHAFERLNLHEEAYECYDYAVLVGADRSTAWSAAYYAAQSCCRWDLAASAAERFNDYLMWGGENRAAPFQMLTMNY